MEELTVHGFIEEELFYPTVKGLEGHGGEEPAELVKEAEEEHAQVKTLLAELETMDPTDEYFDAKVTVVIDDVRHHAEEEEGEMFPKVRDAMGRNRPPGVRPADAPGEGESPEAAALRGVGLNRAGGQVRRRSLPMRAAVARTVPGGGLGVLVPMWSAARTSAGSNTATPRATNRSPAIATRTHTASGRAPDDSLLGPAEVADRVPSSSARDGLTSRTSLSVPASDGAP